MRVQHTLVYSGASNRMIRFGGLVGPNTVFTAPMSNAVWVLTNADASENSTPTWTRVTFSSSQPGARAERSTRNFGEPA